jgi:large repetitive protein
MPTELLGQTKFLAEGDPGVCLRLGSVAVETNAGGLQIKPESIQVDPVAVYIGGIYDFIAYGLPEQGQSYSLVIPQRVPVPANAGYRKYSDARGWVAFVRNEKNSVSSSPGESGYCPPPGDASWTPGLTEGHWCVQVTVEDGGPNDDDGVANGAIVDPGGVAVELNGNSLPVAVADQVTMQVNQSVVVDVLANDTDADADVLSIAQAVSNFGTVTILADQHLSYTPNTDFIGTDTVVYSVTDGKGGTASSELVVTILGNTAPVAVNDTAATDDRTAIVIRVLANDTDAEGQTLSVSSATAVRGAVAIQADQSIRYTPAVGFNGTDTISYTITDGAGGEATAQVAVTVRAYQDVVVDNKSSGGSMSLWMVVMLASVVVLRRRSMLGLAAVLLLSFSSFSQSADWYLQGSVGTSKADLQQSQLLDGVPAGTVTGFDDSDSLYAVNLGYKVHPYVAVELGYLDLGEASSQISGDSLTPAQYHELVKAATPVLADGWTLSARLSVWQNEQWSIEVPLGLFKWESEIESSLNASTLSTDLDGTDWFLGAQLNYQFAPDWLVGLGFQQLNLAPNDINSWLLSVRYQF